MVMEAKKQEPGLGGWESTSRTTHISGEWELEVRCGHKISRSAPSDVFPPTRLHLPKQCHMWIYEGHCLSFKPPRGAGESLILNSANKIPWSCNRGMGREFEKRNRKWTLLQSALAVFIILKLQSDLILTTLPERYRHPPDSELRNMSLRAGVRMWRIWCHRSVILATRWHRETETEQLQLQGLPGLPRNYQARTRSSIQSPVTPNNNNDKN